MKILRLGNVGMLWAVLQMGAAAGLGAATTQPVVTTTAPAEDAISQHLQKSKEIYDQETEAAKKRLSAFFALRADTAQKQGDLAGLKTYSELKSNFEADGTYPLNSAEPLVRDNVNAYLFATRLAVKNLSIAYGETIKAYTKAGRIPEAEVMQVEAETFANSTAGVTGAPVAANGGGGTVMGGGENGKWVPLTSASGLPKAFEANRNVQVGAEGLLFPSLTYFRSARADYLNLDFTLDVVAQVKAKEQLKVGIGPAEAGKTSMAGITLTTGGMARSEMVGELGKVGPGTHLFHLEKHGKELVTSVVLNYTGKYAPDYKKSANLSTMRWLTSENSHLFISATGDGVIIKQIRLTQ